jgi:hypothetical protein
MTVDPANMSPEELLELAQGGGTSDAARKLKLRQEWLAPPKSPQDASRQRRRVRKMLLKIAKQVELRTYEDAGLREQVFKEIFEDQLDHNLNMRWGTFTWIWDVSVQNPFQVIRKDKWFSTGGGVDEFGSMYPSGFTEQMYTDKRPV